MFFLNVFGEFCWENPLIMGANLIFIAGMPINDIFLPYLFGRLVETIKNKRAFTLVFTMIIATLVLVMSMSVLSDWHDTFMSPKFQGFVRNRVMKSVFHQHQTQYHTELPIGSLLTLFVKAPNTILNLFNQIKDHILPYLALFTCAIAYFSSIDWLIGVVICGVVVLLFALIFISPQTCAKVSMNKSSLYNRMQDEVDDLLHNLPSVYTSDRIGEELHRFSAYDKHYQTSCQKTMNCVLLFKAIGFPLIIGLFAFFMHRCQGLVSRGSISVGTFVTMLLILTSLTSNLMWCVDVIREIVFDIGFVMNSEKQLRTHTEPVTVPVQAPSNRPPPPSSGFGLDHVSYTYPGMAKPSLSDLTLHFTQGERVVVVGAIGAGKSTMTKLMAKLLTATQGDLYINGRWYADLTPSEVRKLVGYVPQQPVLFNRSVYENLRYGNEATEADIDRLVDDIGVAQEFSSLTEGMRTVIGKGGSKLSGGQRQLVWCLRTMLSHPDVVIMDEPTASMDLATKRKLERILDVMTERKIVIIISHDEFMVQQASRVVRLE